MGFWVDLEMINRIIPLLLFIGFVWGQADLDKLVLKDGTTYFGEYSKIEEEIVYFNKISQRKTRLILGSVAVTVGVAFVISLALSNLSMDFGGGDYNGHTPW